ncbi:unnamed protein product [Protopolystoma xenopodis]|uniref:Uncharacterized protein n=1 Tax=Protopolystoma xenopodis TaxID=117903 RepID=A0A3S5BBI0_9PLAT|nr:unnamed protein product [Protopolystoma xenopodis]
MKTSKKKRKMFDSGKQRIITNDQVSDRDYKPHRVAQRSVNDPRLLQAVSKKHNWRAKHEEFIRTIHAAKAYNSAVSRGVPPPPPPPPTINPGKTTFSASIVKEDLARKRLNAISLFARSSMQDFLIVAQRMREESGSP